MNPVTTRLSMEPQLFAEELQDGETLLWQGKPIAIQYVRPKAVRDAVLILPVAFFFIWAESARYGGSIKLWSPAFFIVGLLIFAVGAWALFHETMLQAESACYGLTDKRVIIQRLVTTPTHEKRLRTESFGLVRLKPKLAVNRRGSRAVGTITFGLPTLDYSVAFRAIPEADEVFRLLTEARAALPHQDTEVPYYARRSRTAASSPAFDLAEHLRRGEVALWQGRPNVDKYLRRVVPAEAACGALLLPFIGGLYIAAYGSFTWLRLAGLIAAGVLIAFPLVWWAYGKTARRLSYVVTNQRVIIVKSAGQIAPTLDDRPLAGTRSMRLQRERTGAGTIVFEKRSRFIWHGMGGAVVTTEFSFKSIDDAESVYALIAAARNAQPGSPSRDAPDATRPAAV